MLGMAAFNPGYPDAAIPLPAGTGRVLPVQIQALQISRSTLARRFGDVVSHPTISAFDDNFVRKPKPPCVHVVLFANSRFPRFLERHQLKSLHIAFGRWDNRSASFALSNAAGCPNWHVPTRVIRGSAAPLCFDCDRLRGRCTIKCWSAPMAERTKKKKKAGPIAEQPEPIAYRDCVVTFIDILGFRNIVSRRSPEKIQQIVDLVQRHAGSGDRAFAEKHPFDINDGMPWTRTIFFSDSVVRVRPYDREIHDGSLFYELLDLVHAQGELVHRGIFVRGGLTVGKLYHRDNVLFGPAMVQAYDLESKLAISPRIVIDPAALDALRTDKRLRSEDHDLDDEWNYIRKLLRRGKDELHYVDYLGAFRDEMDDYDAFPDFLAQVKVHVVANAAAAKANPGVLQKYLWCARYLNATAERFQDCRDQEHIQIGERDIPGFRESS